MDKLHTMDVPADILPTSQTHRYGNQFHARQSFPFQSYSTIPSFSVVVENIWLSCGTIFASVAGLFVTMTVFLPLGILKSTISMLARLTGYSKKRRYQHVDGMKRCVVINGASSGIGATLVNEYAATGTHLVLIARDLTRLSHVAQEAKRAGATAEVHSIDFLKPDSLHQLRSLLHKIDDERHGIDIAISCESVTGHREDVIGKEDNSKYATAHNIAPESRASVLPAETGLEWGVTAAERIVQVNISSVQTFALTCWALMKARREQNPNGPPPNITLLASSAAFFFPANFVLYSASKSYIYSLGQGLRVLSLPYGIRITTVCPGFIESGMTLTMIKTGATSPVGVLGDPRKLARRIREGEERNEAIVMYPFSHAVTLYAARALNPLLELLGMWVGGLSGMASYQMS